MDQAAADSFPSVQVFGRIGVTDAEGPVSIGGPRQRRLLALLVIKSGSVLTNDWLAENLWHDGDRPATVDRAIRTYMSRLRLSLPEMAQSWIETESSGYRWVGPPEAVEHERFALLRAESTRARELEDPLTASKLLDEALSLWRGDPFRELEDLDWARGEIEQLRLDRLEMLEERWEAALALGRHTQITGELAAFTAEHGLRDRAIRQHALALHRSGRTTEALRVIDRHRRTLADQSGLEPSDGIVELEAALLSGDPALNVEKVGRPLRGYRLVEEIGSGAFSVVWRGSQPSVDREVAIKQIRSELASQPEFIRRFEAEAHLVARIEHPHIVPLIDYWRDPDSAYLVMRWLRGGTLERRLDDGPLTLEETLALARQIGGALSAAHAHGVVHRDVKTANILFDEQGNAFLTDFGIALEVAESSGPEAALSPGSPSYAAPEQIRQERLGPQADIFSLGVVLFECLNGSLPFPIGGSVQELIELQLQTPYPALADLGVDVPGPVSDAVARATAKDAGMRFESVRAFLAALEADGGESAGQALVDVADAATDDIANPYNGLRAFDDGDSDRFFGRASLVSELVERFAHNTVVSRFVAVVGPSGSGKSSVVSAGLVPALRAGAVPNSSQWFITTMVPGNDPFESLEAALLRVAVNPPQSLLAQLREGKRGILRSLRRCLASDDDEVLVVIDQFEEVFTRSSAQDAHEFLDALSVAVEDPTSPLRLVLTLRADYYHRALGHPSFARIFRQVAVDVAPLAPNELEQAIVEPARRVGIDFEPGLVPRIAAETIGQPSPLPLLQFALSELFDRRVGPIMTVAAYAEIGGLSGALAARAEAVYSEAADDERIAMRRIFGALTNPGEEAADLRRRVPIADLGDDPATRWVLERFGAARLISFDRDAATRSPIAEVAHEALLREWPRLVGWLREDLDVLHAVDSVVTATTTWDDGGRESSDLYRGERLDNAVALGAMAQDRFRPIDSEFIAASRVAREEQQHVEERRVRRLRRLVAGVGLALVFALVAGGVAVNQRNEARRAVDDAELATLISRSAAQAGEDSEVSLLLALEAYRRSGGPDSEQAVLNALGASTLVNRVLSRDVVADPGNCDWFSSDGQIEFAISDGQLVSRDPLSGVVTRFGSPPDPCVRWLGSEEGNLRWAATSDGRRMWFGPFDGPWEVEKQFEVPMFLVKSAYTPSNLLLFRSDQDDPAVVILIDGSTGEEVGTTISGGDFLLRNAADFSADGKFIALGFASNGGPDGDGTTLIVDGGTGREISRVASAVPATALSFDSGSGELIAGMFDGSIITVDPETGEVLSEVETTTTSRIFDVGVRADGLIVVVSESQIELMDRRSGPAGTAVEARNLINARVRPDGTVLTLTAERRVEIIDIEGNALIERSYDVDALAKTSFNGGLVGVGGFPIGDPEIIDLSTGERASFELVTSDGERLSPSLVLPDSDGMWVDADGVSRWEDGQMVEEIDLGGPDLNGTLFGDLLAVVVDQADGDRVVRLLDLAPGATRLVFTVAVPNASTATPSVGRGLHVIDADGVLRTYDRNGQLLAEVQTGAEDVNVITVDPATGTLAIAAMPGGVLLVEPGTGEIQRLPGADSVANLGFGRDGEILAITRFDGTVRLWDVLRGVSGGLVWNGSGAVPGSPSWYDEASESIWVTSSGKILQIPLNPQRWVERACAIVGRDFTQDEWDRFVPGGGEVQAACP